MSACTGISARWCPVHGDCTCPYVELIGWSDEENETCPIHGRFSDHPLPDPEDPEELLP